eukprot:CAMPEP_0180450158 /NCGR_PEP_ID=MMETSP1036_2-20121128/18095_1 /TAXON_ID=632150 /ORGANISM="Azadinium spinosum, Strain 3D9" /LENGTH=238 /DNA_ID=CAMNT_0022456591 /DNA_START=103 /DNA_END=819 /DNA_ORIENTATION=+
MGAQCCRDEADQNTLKFSTPAEGEAVMQFVTLDEKPLESDRDGSSKEPIPEVPEKEPTEPEAEPQEVVLLFDHEGIQTPVTFKRSPTGMIFNNSMPIIIDNVFRDGYAESLGVQKNWNLVAIDGQKLQGMSFEGAVAKMESALKALPRVKEEAHFVFKTKNPDETRGVVITSAPAGFTYNHCMPITISSVSPGGHADRLGVQANWILSMVNQQDVTCVKFQDAESVIKTAVKELPQTG